MVDDSSNVRLRRKRRKLGRRDDEAQEGPQEEQRIQVVAQSSPSYDFVHLTSLILAHDLPVLFPGSQRPRNAYALIGAGGSFLVFKEERTMNDLVIRSEQIRSLEDTIVWKRTREHNDRLYPYAKSNERRYSAIMSELQILLDPYVQADENIVDLHGLTWDFEPEDDGSHSV